MSATLPSHGPNCLGCGEANPAGMGLRFRADGERVRGHFTLDRRHEGAPGFAHGGAVATVLDDALGSLLVMLKLPAVTARLEVNYRRPALVGRRFEVEAWVESRQDRKLRLAGELRENGERVADASGLFVEVDRAHFLRGATADAGADSGVRGDELPW